MGIGILCNIYLTTISKIVFGSQCFMLYYLSSNYHAFIVPPQDRTKCGKNIISSTASSGRQQPEGGSYTAHLPPCWALSKQAAGEGERRSMLFLTAV